MRRGRSAPSRLDSPWLSDHEPGPYAEALVDGRGAPVAGDELGAGGGCRCGNEGVVGSAAGDGLLRQAEHECPIRSSAQAQIRLGKAAANEVASDCRRAAVRWWQSREDRVGFERAMLDQPHPGIERAPERAAMRRAGTARRRRALRFAWAGRCRLVPARRSNAASAPHRTRACATTRDWRCYEGHPRSPLLVGIRSSVPSSARPQVRAITSALSVGD